MSPRAWEGLVLVLASRRAFEAFAGPLPKHLESVFRFRKANQATRIRALLPACRLMISKSYLPPRLNRWIFEARRRGVPTLLLVDGPLEWSNLYSKTSLSAQMGIQQAGRYEPIVHDAVAGIGEAQNHWIAHRNEGRGVELMTYANRRIQTLGQAATAPHTSPDLDFLVTTARTPYFGEAEQRDLTRLLIDVCQALSAGSHRHAVRIFDADLIRALRSAIPDVRIDTAGDFAGALARTRCVIGGPSSVLLEAMAHDKPTGTLMFRDSPLFYQSGWLLGCTSDWEASFQSMLARESKRMERQRQILHENLSEEDFYESCERILAGDSLLRPRPLDAADLEFENRTLRRLLGWRARLLSPFFRGSASKAD